MFAGSKCRMNWGQGSEAKSRETSKAVNDGPSWGTGKRDEKEMRDRELIGVTLTGDGARRLEGRDSARERRSGWL